MLTQLAFLGPWPFYHFLILSASRYCVELHCGESLLWPPYTSACMCCNAIGYGNGNSNCVQSSMPCNAHTLQYISHPL